MKRFFPLGLIGLAATATMIAAPFTMNSANAQDYPLLQELELSDEQKEEVQDIFQDFRGDLDDILTDDQQEQFWMVYQELQDVQAAVLAIDNLTDSQKDALRETLQDSQAELSAVLSDEQLAELRSIRQERRQNRHR